MVNALTRKTGLSLGPIIFETLLKHYFDRIAKDHESEESTRLRREELLYDEAFNIVKVRPQRLLRSDYMRLIPVCYSVIHGGCDEVSHQKAPRAT